MKPILAINDEEASAASDEPSTSGQFPVFKQAQSASPDFLNNVMIWKFLINLRQRSLGKTVYCGRVNRDI
ncbi:hypothetical protein T10_1169 [Trichinella papuae]|uniref:Uncharacterized protein n=1 Tax=Trichinella papuae TaxID=268474 RepID=A0A0V1MTR4_9BILA|nr:hypothetical protein T10_1169 [Trichinella papuae]